MAHVSTYVDTTSRTEKAFEFCRSVFVGEFTDLQCFRDMDMGPDSPQMSVTDAPGVARR